jgi:hypothetical protein
LDGEEVDELQVVGAMGFCVGGLQVVVDDFEGGVVLLNGFNVPIECFVVVVKLVALLFFL